jgi:hypothetical protein
LAFLRPLLTSKGVPLTLLAAQETRLRDIKRQVVQYDDPLWIEAELSKALVQLKSIDQQYESSLQGRLSQPVKPDVSNASLRAVKEVFDQAHQQKTLDLFDHQRIALWLTAVGLGAICASSAFLGHEKTMLVGAIGGFLAPAVSALTSTSRTSTWGVLVLSPVGGALTGLMGLLLVYFLSSDQIGILGKVFNSNSWDNPETAIALTLALLFGFSGRLFSQLALQASTRLTSPEAK